MISLTVQLRSKSVAGRAGVPVHSFVLTLATDDKVEAERRARAYAEDLIARMDANGGLHVDAGQLRLTTSSRR